MARRGRPTNDPKATMLAVRVAARHLQLLEGRAARDQVSVSEALRRYLDEALKAARRARGREIKARDGASLREAASPRARRS